MPTCPKSEVTEMLSFAHVCDMESPTTLVRIFGTLSSDVPFAGFGSHDDIIKVATAAIAGGNNVFRCFIIVVIIYSMANIA